jgi:phenylalanyl-tRNA synthetase beta chain
LLLLQAQFFAMKISYNWLKTILEFNETPQEISDLLTSSGLEVEAIEPWQSLKGGLIGFVTGHVLTCQKHPDADRLSITTVDVGAENVLHIVCGAPNVAQGQKVIVATVGTIIYPQDAEPFEIKKSKIRGEVSEGMICAQDEIGIGTSHDGILVLPADTNIGVPAANLFGIETDHCIEIGLTPNRSDAMSHLGVARELKSLLKVRKNKESNLLFTANDESKQLPISPIAINVHPESLCKRYSGIVLENIHVHESPQWLKNKLAAVGLRSINNVVDVSNFVMLETGQPLHAFDFSKINNSTIEVRKALENEVLITLDSIQRKLTPKDVVIANGTNAMCLAGIMGGLDSGVSISTSKLFLESASFDSVAVRKSSKHHTLKSDSSFRFERGTDPNMVLIALNRAVELLKEIAGAQENYSAIDVYPTKIEKQEVEISKEKINSLIGVELSNETLEEIFTSLDFSYTANNNNYYLKIPTSKVDVTRPADVIEEVLRIYGYDNIGEKGYFTIAVSDSSHTKYSKLKDKIANHLVAKGCIETMNLSLTSSEFINKFHIQKTENKVKVLNPLSSEQDVLRTSLVFGCLQSLAYNINRKQNDLKLFEFGKVYEKTEKGYHEKEVLAICVSGNVSAESWKNKSIKTDFYFIKSVLEQVLNFLPQKSLSPSQLSEFWGNQGLTYNFGNQQLCSVGKVDSSMLKSFDIKQDVFYAELDWEKFVIYYSDKLGFAELNKFPAVRRDFAFELNVEIEYQKLKEIAFKTEKKLLKEVNIFDVYQGEKMDEHKKSYALSFMLQDELGTLSENQINSAMNKLKEAFEKETGASLR